MTKRQNFLLVSVVLLLIGIASVMVQMKLTTILPSLTERFAMEQTQVSLLMSMFTFVGLILALPVGFAAKRFGARKMLLAGVGFILAGSLVGAFAGGSAMLIASRAIEGVAYIIIITCGPLAIERYVAPVRLGTAMGIWGTYGCGGTLVSGALTPTLYEVAGFTGLWLAYAVFALLTGAPLRSPFRRQPSQVIPRTLPPSMIYGLRVRASAAIARFSLPTCCYSFSLTCALTCSSA